MLPAYGPQWTALGVDCGNTLRGINVVVKDLESTLHALQSVFVGSLSLLQTATPFGDGGGHYMVVEVGMVRIAYIQPAASGALARFLQQRGPAVHSLVAEIVNLCRAERGLEARGIATSNPEQVLYTTLGGTGSPAGKTLQAHTLETMGVEFTLLESEK